MQCGPNFFFEQEIYKRAKLGETRRVKRQACLTKEHSALPYWYMQDAPAGILHAPKVKWGELPTKALHLFRDSAKNMEGKKGEP